MEKQKPERSPRIVAVKPIQQAKRTRNKAEGDHYNILRAQNGDYPLYEVRRVSSFNIKKYIDLFE